MPPSLKKFLLVFLPVAAAVAATTQISTEQPIINFRLPTFTPDGHRSWLIRGSEARLINQNQIDIKDLTLSVFSTQDESKVETLILSPTATVRPGDAVITGGDSIRVINDEFEATGADWRYEHKEKRVSIARNVRVTFNAEIKDFLK